MKLPNLEHAIIPEHKIIGYLLSLSHRDGRGKAVFFLRFGFSSDAWQGMAEALQQHAVENPGVRIEDSPFGQRYVVERPITAPDGRRPIIRVIWFVEAGEEIPKLVTAYPL